MIGILVSYLISFIRSYGLALGLGVATFGAYTTVDVSFGTESQNTAVVVSLGLIAVSTAEQKSATGRRKTRPLKAASGERREGVARPEFSAGGSAFCEGFQPAVRARL